MAEEEEEETVVAIAMSVRTLRSGVYGTQTQEDSIQYVLCQNLLSLSYSPVINHASPSRSTSFLPARRLPHQSEPPSLEWALPASM